MIGGEPGWRRRRGSKARKQLQRVRLKPMGGESDDAPVLAIDHDQRFKILLETFFFEFLELFFPKFASSVEPSSIEFLQQEVFASLMDC